MRRAKHYKKSLILFSVLILAALLIVSFNDLAEQRLSQDGQTIVSSADGSSGGKQTGFTQAGPVDSAGGRLKVHFIDVGQADAILIEQEDEAMVIDAGGNASGQQVVDYIKQQGITTLKYVIGTHPHEDHIGGLDDVIDSFIVEKVILPDIVHTTKTFEDVLSAIQNKNLKVTRAEPGLTFDLGQAAFSLVGPVTIDQKDLNNASVVCLLTFGDNAFLFTGDAEISSEKAILRAGYKVAADVLKVGHHGSKTSTSEEFLDAVAPAWAVIQTGLNNKYGHPADSVLERLNRNNITIWRTDLDGTVIAFSDGQNITFAAEKK